MMDAARAEIWNEAPTQAQLDWLRRSGLDVMALIRPTITMMTSGVRHQDGRFDFDPAGMKWLAFEEDEDFVFWQPRTGELATAEGRAFALGEALIGDAWTYSFDCSLNIFTNPLEWLRAKRDGIVVLDWSIAFDRLRDCPRVAVAEAMLFNYRRHMKPRHTPELFVIPKPWRIAA
jgi:hypothetical protein